MDAGTPEKTEKIYTNWIIRYRKYSATLQKYTLSERGKGWYPFAMASKTNRKE